MSNIRPSLAELRQLQGYLEDVEREGCYNGNKAHFEQRHIRLRIWIDGMVQGLDGTDQDTKTKVTDQ